MSFIGVLESIGKGFAKGLTWAVSYAVAATTLIQNAVLIVEQKYAASGVAKGTGPQKLAEVVQLSGDAVTSLLSAAGIKADTAYIEKLVSAVVGILNVQALTTSTPAAS
jgi:hypothetical protein